MATLAQALRQFQFRVGASNFCVVHVSLVPVLGAVGEQKTKPTQHSVAVLRSLGLNPTLLVCRSSDPLQQSVREKLVQSSFPVAGLLQADVRPVVIRAAAHLGCERGQLPFPAIRPCIGARSALMSLSGGHSQPSRSRFQSRCTGSSALMTLQPVGSF